MIRIASSLFCEKLVLAGPGMPIAIGIYPGVVNGVIGQQIKVDSMIFAEGKVGTHQVDIRVRGVDGSVIQQFDNFDIRVDIADQHSYLHLSDMVIPVQSAGRISIDIREKGSDWLEATSLRIRAHAPNDQGTDFSSSLDGFLGSAANSR